MFEWISRLRRPRTPTRKLGSRNAHGSAERLLLAKFAPGMLPFLGLTSYLQLKLYEASARALVAAADLKAKEVLARSASVTLNKHHHLTAELRRRNREPHLAMRPYTAAINRYVTLIDTPDWHQHILSIYLVGGFFDEFFAELAHGITDKFQREATTLLLDHSGRDDLRTLLAAEIAADPHRAHHLALWGRRLIGDTLLICRDVLILSEHRVFVASQVEPIFTDLITEHSRRMSDLGLTA